MSNIIRPLRWARPVKATVIMDGSYYGAFPVHPKQTYDCDEEFDAINILNALRHLMCAADLIGGSSLSNSGLENDIRGVADRILDRMEAEDDE